jgi:hypothetical protein
MKMDALIKSLFAPPKKAASAAGKSIKPVNAKRKKVRSPAQLINYVTGNGIVDWLMRHPEEVNVKFAPVKFKVTHKTALEQFIEEVIKSINTKAKFKYTVLTPSDYGCATILAMREKYDIIFNATLVDRPGGRMSKVDALVKSSVINRAFKTMYTDNHPCQFSANSAWHYVPMCFVDHRDKTSGTVAEMNIAVAVSVLSKYQKYQPDLGYKVEGGPGHTILAATYRPVNYTLIQQGMEWLDSLDEIKEKPAPDFGANAKISCASPWCSAVKYKALEQEHITMLPNVAPTMNCMEWTSIEEAEGSNWIDNYYSETGTNMHKFKALTQPMLFVSVSEIDGAIYQATVVDSATGDVTYIVADSLQSSDVKERLQAVLTQDNNVWGWGINPYVIGLTGVDIQDMRKFCDTNGIKFPLTSNYDLDFIGYRALPESLHDQIPVVNFSLDQVAREYYYGSPDSKTRKDLLKCMQQASLHDPKILQLLLKMTQV